MPGSPVLLTADDGDLGPADIDGLARPQPAAAGPTAKHPHGRADLRRFAPVTRSDPSTRQTSTSAGVSHPVASNASIAVT